MSLTRVDLTKQTRPISSRLWYKLLISVVTLLLLLLGALLGGLAIVSHGPSPAARNLFVVSAMETSAMKFLPHLFFFCDRSGGDSS